MTNFWDERYAQPEYAYGTMPNDFFKHQLDSLTPGTLLLPAEGEGRNAVYAASRGWKVTAIDFSEQAKVKALELAKQQHVEIEYRIASHHNFDNEGQLFDVIALIYVHLPEVQRHDIHKKYLSMLKSGGTLLLEAFSKEQLGKSSGGPQELSMLYHEDDLFNDFQECSHLQIERKTILLQEGLYHQGEAEVCRVVAVK